MPYLEPANTAVDVKRRRLELGPAQILRALGDRGSGAPQWLRTGEGSVLRGRPHAEGAMFNNILVGLDGSERQPAILRQAVELADRCGGKLHLCQAMQVPVSIPALAWSFQGDDFQGFLLEHAKKTLERVAKTLPDGLVAKTWSELGQPADVLCRLAAENDFDLIVIGSHGYDGIDRLLGTTAAKVTNRAPCSVVIVRERDAQN